MAGLSRENVRLNRKSLAELAMNEPFSFRALVDQVRFMTGRGGGAAASSGGAATGSGSRSGTPPPQ
jgi:large subunit ribosomal protein L20